MTSWTPGAPGLGEAAHPADVVHLGRGGGVGVGSPAGHRHQPGVQQFEAVEVVWDDSMSYNSRAWYTRGQLDDSIKCLSYVRTNGYFYKYTKKSIVLVRGFSALQEDGSVYSPLDPFEIPKGCIRTVKRLK